MNFKNAFSKFITNKLVLNVVSILAALNIIGYLFMENYVWQGFAIVIYGVLIISTIDNIFRFVFQSKIADVHPLITILGVIFGLKFFGVSGLIFGPLLISYFLIFIKMYQKEYLEAVDEDLKTETSAEK
jgi:predicted PurR-regulated permease PerM